MKKLAALNVTTIWYAVKNLFFIAPKKNIPALDFLRTMAIILVFLTHSYQVFYKESGIFLKIFKVPFIQAGWIGVQLFFVLSGYLIGYQLWKQYREHFKINYKEFLIKRSLRIWPLYYAVSFFLLVVRGPIDPTSNFLPDLFFISNYFKHNLIFGSWSLSTEEQFYLTLPVLFYLFGKIKLSMLNWRIVLITLLVLAPIIRQFVIFNNLGDAKISARFIIDNLYFPFHTNYDCLVMGVLLSNIKVSLNCSNWKNTSLILFILIIITGALRFINTPLFNYSFTASLFGFSVWSALHLKGKLNTFFASPIFYLIAKLSFGVYLVHYELMKRLYPKLLPLLESANQHAQYYLSTFLIFIISLLICALLNYFIENPSIKLKKFFIK